MIFLYDKSFKKNNYKNLKWVFAWLTFNSIDINSVLKDTKDPILILKDISMLMPPPMAPTQKQNKD